MRFFCAECQAQYDTKIISADMWSICKEHIVANLNKIQKQYTGEEGNLFNNLVRAINEDTLRKTVNGKSIPIKSAFALNLENMGSRLQNRQKKDGYTLQGEYTLTLEQLLDIFSGYSAAYDKELIPEEGWQAKVCSLPLQVHLNKQFILDYVSDLNNLPFPADESDNAEMLGFRHICPHCGRKLSRAVGTAEEIVVALAGGPRAGKTATMYAMLNSLLSGQCPAIEVVRPNQDVIWKNMLDVLEIYKKGRKVPKTDADKNKEVPSFSIPIRCTKTNRQKILTMVDMAGEFWMGANGFSREW